MFTSSHGQCDDPLYLPRNVTVGSIAGPTENLDPPHIKAFFPTLSKVTGRFARRWQRAAVAGQTIDLQADLMRYTVDVTAGLAFGADIHTVESDGQVIQSHLDKILPALT